MDESERRTVKRSRFDQTEPEPRRSRFDRRSRSPARKPDSGRERSPLKGDADGAPEIKRASAVDAAAAAGKFLVTRELLCARALTTFIAAAAAKINAQIQAKKGIQHVDVPPIRSTSSESPGPNASNATPNNINGEIYVADGDYIKDIEVNDLRNRYLLTKGSTQKMVNTPCVFLLILSDFRLPRLHLFPSLFSIKKRPRMVLLTRSMLARTRIPSVASADLKLLI